MVRRKITVDDQKIKINALLNQHGLGTSVKEETLNGFRDDLLQRIHRKGQGKQLAAGTGDKRPIWSMRLYWPKPGHPMRYLFCGWQREPGSHRALVKAELANDCRSVKKQQ